MISDIQAEKLCKNIAKLIVNICDSKPYDNSKKCAIFTSKFAVKNIELFIPVIHDILNFDPACFTCVAVYIKRLHKNNFYINWYNVHRVIISALMVAEKFLDDEFHDIDDLDKYARILGQKSRYIGKLESKFISLIQFDVAVLFDEFEYVQEWLLDYDGNAVNIP